jgi:hypothetical protein
MTDDSAVIDTPVDEPVDEPVDDTAENTTDASPRPSLGPVIALGLAAAVAIAAIVVAIVGGDAVSPTALRVNTGEVSQKTFDGQLGELASAVRTQQVDAGAPVTATEAYLPSASTAQLASLHVSALLLSDELDRLGVTVSDDDLRSFEQANREQLSAYSGSLRDFIVEVNVLQGAFVNEVVEARAAAIFTRAARRADIHVDARYGFWNPARGEVCPPTGCAAASSTDSGSATDSSSTAGGG